MRALGAVYGPYTGTCFSSTAETDIEHIVAASEAHDSGLCARDAATKARFARDLRNLTLASPRVNRHEKSGKDAAEWVPDRNRCWFAARVLEVRRAYGLTIDRREAAALDRILAACESMALEPVVCAVPSASASAPARAPAAGDDALARYDDNRNGRITCKEARRHGIAPVPRKAWRGHPVPDSEKMELQDYRRLGERERDAGQDYPESDSEAPVVRLRTGAVGTGHARGSGSGGATSSERLGEVLWLRESGARLRHPGDQAV